MGAVKEYTEKYAASRGITVEEAEKHKIVQHVKEYYEEVESVLVKEPLPERKCDS